MKIDWTALVVVAGVSIVATVAFVVLVALGVRLLATAALARDAGDATPMAQRTGQLCVALAGVLVLFCLWLIVPQFH